MRIDRRSVLKAGAAGAVGILQAGQIACSNSPSSSPPATDTSGGLGSSLRILIRGLSLIEYQQANKAFVIHMVDAAKFGMPAHMARLRVGKDAIDADATSLAPSSKEQEGTSKEAWLFDLAGQTVSVLEDSDPPDADRDTSTPSGDSPTLGDWSSMKWVPNIKDLTGCNTVSTDSSNFVCNISLKHGHMQGDDPYGKVGKVAKWTFKKPASAGGTTITKQMYTDTVRYTRQLKGRTPVVTIGTGKVVLRSRSNAEVVFENASPPPATPPPPTAPITIGHFPVLYKVVNSAWEPDASVEPPDLSSCKGCEGDPIFCPPAWGGF
jgi:hypothetical protein